MAQREGTGKSGWCMGPEGARPPHDRCPIETCACECHREPSRP